MVMQEGSLEVKDEKAINVGENGNPVENQAPAESAEPEVRVNEAGEPVDGKGVPVKNREAEYRRLEEKRRKVHEEVQELERKKAELERAPAQKQYAVSPYKPTDISPVSEAYWEERESETGLTRFQIYNQEQTTLRVISAYDRQKSESESALIENVDKLIEKYPKFAKYRAELISGINARLKTPSSKRDINSVEITAKNLYFDLTENGEIQEPAIQQAQVRRPAVNRTTTIVSRPAAGGVGTGKPVTPEMRRWAEGMGLHLDHTDTEIYDLYMKRHGKKQ